MKKPLRLSIANLMSQPNLLGPHFKGASWDRWRAVVKATFGEPMTAEEIVSFKEVAGGREPPKNRVNEAVYAIGRDGGKDSVASLIATYIAATFDPKGKLRPGEKAIIACIAVDRDQAGVVAGYIRGYFEEIAALKPLVKSFERTGVKLKNGVEILVVTNSYRSIRGRTIICAIFDEIAFWRDENSANPDVEVANAVAPALARVPGSMLILISTVYRRAGLLYEQITNYFGKDDDDVLAVLGTTQQFNSKVRTKIIDAAIAKDAARGNAEYNSIWRDDVSGFLGRELVESAVDAGVVVRAPQPGIFYYCFVDSSGGRNDSFTAAIAHKDSGGKAILDAAIEYRGGSDFRMGVAIDGVVELARSYHCTTLVGDNFSADMLVELFRKAGLPYEKSERVRDKIYADVSPLFASGLVRLLDSKRLISQFAELERRPQPGGREIIRKSAGGHDDLCNAAAGALVLAAASKPPMKVSSSTLERASMPTAYTHRYPDSARRTRPMKVFF
jgi:hypothetical protein